MEGLLTLLLFAGFFYLMMRFGCGAHAVHGGGGQGSHAGKIKDPVCGMELQPEQGYGKTQAGREYRFCSRSCLDKFDADPNRYIDASGGTS